MNNRIFIAFIAVIELISCSSENQSIKNPSSSFEIISQSEYNVLTEISFQNTSENSNDFKWDFGDGNESIVENPTHRYDSIGTYTIKLISSNETKSDTSKQIIEIVEYSNGYLYCNGEFYDINSCRIEKNYILNYPYSFKIIFKNGFDYESETWPVVIIHVEGELQNGYHDFFDIGIGNVVFLNSNETIDLTLDLDANINIIDSENPLEVRIVSSETLLYYKGEASVLDIISEGD